MTNNAITYARLNENIKKIIKRASLKSGENPNSVYPVTLWGSDGSGSDSL